MGENMNLLQQKIYDRFVRYIAVDTTSDPESSSVPSTSAQISFAHTLAAEMKRVGLAEVEVDEYGFVTGLVPANTDKPAPVIGLFAHMDTVADYNGANIRPVLHPNYDGGTLTINAEKKMFLRREIFFPAQGKNISAQRRKCSCVEKKLFPGWE